MKSFESKIQTKLSKYMDVYGILIVPKSAQYTVHHSINQTSYLSGKGS